MIQVEPGIYLLAALLILLLPLDWLLAAFFAALVHEVCHLVSIILMGGTIYRIHIGIGGTMIETELMDSKKELLSAMAGPLGSLCLVFLCRLFPRLAICALVQGLYNLLPLYPSDGGRILRCILQLNWPERAKRVETAVRFALIPLSILICFILSAGALPVVIVAVLILKDIIRKRPCKRSQIRVQ